MGEKKMRHRERNGTKLKAACTEERSGEERGGEGRGELQGYEERETQQRSGAH